MQTSIRSDLIVVGGGLVGASLARAARGLSVSLVAAGRPAPVAFSDGNFDSRVYALSPGNVAFLRSIKVWDSISADRLTPVHAIKVYGDEEGAAIEFDAYRAGVSELAWIVEDRALQTALWHALDTQDGLEILSPARCERLDLGATAHITLEDGMQLEADLILAADGADSFVRKAAGIRVSDVSYGQSAVVANFSCELPHRNTALQWFQGGPVLALLPLPGNRVSMVWSLPSDRAARLISMDAVEMAGTLRDAIGGLLGSLDRISDPLAYPLRRMTAEKMVRPHLALAGDAAHVIHPLAGQGLNLGLQDARSLGAFIAEREPVRRLGDIGLLRRYERERSEAILAMRTAVHGLHSLFDAKDGATRRLRNAGLNLTDHLTVLKHALLRHALH